MNSTTSSSIQAITQEQLNADQIAAWLSQNKDFFIGRESLLASLELEHDCGDSESLLLYQIKLLRETLKQQQQQHALLLKNACDNEQRLKLIEQLVVKLLKAENTQELRCFLQEALERSFAIPFLVIWSPNHVDLPQASQEQYQKQLQLLANKPSVNLQLDSSTAALLGLNDLQQGSAIVCRLNHANPSGLLVIAHPSSNHFRQQDTLFVEYLGSIVSSLLYRHQR